MPEKKHTITIRTDQRNMLLIQGVVLLVIGILLCLGKITQAVNIILGVALLLGGLVNIVVCFMEHKSVIRTEGVFGSALIATGILCFIQGLIPVDRLIMMFLIVVGAITFVDGLLGLLPAVNRKKVPTLVEALVGAVLLTLGLCLWFIPDFAQFASLVLGIAFIVLAVLLFISAFILQSGKRIK